MFGYVLPLTAELKVREWHAYRAYYCGLCKELKREYGFLSRFLLNYDLVLPALLADGMAGTQARMCPERCMANPVEKRPMCQSTAGLALAALAAPGSRALERMGLFVGKIIYYLDAAEDYEKDTRNGAYNVFALQGLSKAEAVAEAQRLCRMCAGEAALAYNLLEPGPCKAILDNIVFLGLPQSIALAGQKRTQPRHGA